MVMMIMKMMMNFNKLLEMSLKDIVKKLLEVREKYNTSLSLRLPSTTHYHKDCNLLAHKKPTHNY